MGKSSPDTPDVEAAAERQGEYDRQTARDTTYADRPNQQNPFGNLEWSTSMGIDPATGEPVTLWDQRQTLNPEIQGMLNQELGMMRGRQDVGQQINSRIGAEMGGAPNWDQFGQAQDLEYSGLEIGQAVNQSGGIQSDPGGSEYSSSATDAFLNYNDQAGSFYFDPNTTRAQAEENAYNKDKMRLDPRYASMQEQIDIRLRNQGLRPGDQSYEAQMGAFSNDRMDAYERARLGAGEVGRAESAQLYNQAKGTYDTNLSGKQYNLDAAYQKAQAQQAKNDAQWGRYKDQFTSQFDEKGQIWDQQMGGTDYSNALRSGDISEYLGKRGFSLGEANSLRGTSYDDVTGMASAWSA